MDIFKPKYERMYIILFKWGDGEEFLTNTYYMITHRYYNYIIGCLFHNTPFTNIPTFDL